MGCDIHFHVERLDVETGAWLPAEEMVPNPWLKHGLGAGDPEFVRDTWYSGRNYALFTVLAGVRMADNSDGSEIISQPRGLPKDASAEVQEESDRWGVDGHSHSYFTLEELLAWDWETPIKDQGYARPPAERGWTPDEAVAKFNSYVAQWKELPPWFDSWCGWTSELSKPDQGGYRLYEWSVPTRRYLGNEWPWTVIRMARAAVWGPQTVRCVFWFDN